MNIHHKLIACFHYYPAVFSSLNDEEFMAVRETELSTLDEHCEIIDELTTKPY